MAITLVFLWLLAMGASAQSPSTAGFISVDCGLQSKAPYKDKNSGLMFSPDEPYTTAGVNKEVSSETDLTGILGYYATVRSFPEKVRNCYTLAPVVAGEKYKVKAEFLYGNYDGLRRPPTFDLYLDVNLWKTVEAGNFSRAEVIALAVSDRMEVCLVNTGRGTPFISELDLRPLPFSMYSQVDSQQSFVITDVRYNFGGQDQIRYPDDAYDRSWYPWMLGPGINTTSTVSQPIGNEFPVPPDVLRTGVTTTSLADPISFTFGSTSEQISYVYIYIAELQELKNNETREFNVYQGERLFLDNFRPRYLQAQVLYTNPPGLVGELEFHIRATANSTLPPLINAVEAFYVREIITLPTGQGDVKAISEVKKSNGVIRNWQGDPCLPVDFIWEGLECSLNASNYSTIASLDLSRSGLSGGIPPSIANLTQLTSLDLSYNNLTGEIPLYFDQLPMLKFLNLEGNNLNGTLSDVLYKRSQSGSLVLRIDKNPILCGSSDLCNSSEKKKKNIILPIAVAVSASFLVLLAVVITVCLLRRRRMNKNQNNTQGELHSKERGTGASPFLPSRNRTPNMSGVGFVSESHLFTLSDISAITENFKRPIGRGGFGVVYHGYLEDATQVAVKVLSLSSAQGEKQFRAEAQLLTRVHHKYLVSLLGYCNENLALVYEFVPLGSLADHLSGGAGAGKMLSWSRRVRIAVEAAQGLDYLHSGCKPPIIHRDVKSSNILLNDNFEVKLADFGLSRSFNEDLTQISTVVAGTPGYLDPEYYQTNRLSESSDVYSFGIVLLELITGKPPIGDDAKRTHITLEVKGKLERGDIAEIMDGRLQGIYDVSSAWKIVEIAMSCTSRNSGERPSIGDVVVQLKECQASEQSREFHSDASTDLLAMIPPYSMKNITPSAR